MALRFPLLVHTCIEICWILNPLPRLREQEQGGASERARLRSGSRSWWGIASLLSTIPCAASVVEVLKMQEGRENADAWRSKGRRRASRWDGNLGGFAASSGVCERLRGWCGSRVNQQAWSKIQRAARAASVPHARSQMIPQNENCRYTPSVKPPSSESPYVRVALRAPPVFRLILSRVRNSATHLTRSR